MLKKTQIVEMQKKTLKNSRNSQKNKTKEKFWVPSNDVIFKFYVCFV